MGCCGEARYQMSPKSHIYLGARAEKSIATVLAAQESHLLKISLIRTFAEICGQVPTPCDFALKIELVYQ